MHKHQPLVYLRPFTLSDVEAVVALAGDYEVSRWTTRIPHPYYRHHAIDWIGQPAQPDRQAFAIDLNGKVAGCVSYWPDEKGLEVGYWIGRPYWNQGLATQALRQMLTLPMLAGHHLITARVMLENLASQRVLEKCGFRQAGQSQVRAHCHSLEAVTYTLAPIHSQ